MSISNDLETARKLLNNKEFENANNIFLNLSKNGNPIAQYELGQSYLRGEGVKKDLKKAFEYFSKSAENNFGPGLVIMCNAYLKDSPKINIFKNEPKALKFCLRAAEAGHVLAQYTLFTIYRTGSNLIRKNYEKAILWGKTALSNGLDKKDVKSFLSLNHELGYMYSKGMGTEINNKISLQYFTTAGHSGFPPSLFALGEIFEFGVGNEIKADLKKAYNYYVLAAKRGNAYSFVNLGLMYKNGRYVEFNKIKAHMWTLLAVLKGDEYASRNLENWNKNSHFRLSSEEKIILKKIVKKCIESNYLHCQYD